MNFAGRFIPVAGEEGLLSMLTYFTNAYLAIGQYRYMDWFIITPLLLLKDVLVLEVKPRKLWGAITVLLLAEARLFWGPVSTVGYILIPLTLLYIYRSYGKEARRWEREAFGILALATVTTWGVYPLGYLVPALLLQLSFNWIHIAFNIADVINKVGAGVIIYVGAANVLEDRTPKEATQEARGVA